jgi:hypothetical protein
MNPLIQASILLLALAGAASAAQAGAAIAASAGGAPGALKPFLEAHCTECHDHDLAKGGLDLTAIGYGADPGTHTRWVRVFDRVAAGEMPPAKKPRPEAAQARAFLDALGKDLTAQHLAMRATVLRRLNRIEYRNTVEDLLGCRVPQYEELPEDARSHGFDTNGEALGLSDVHLQRYLGAAEVALGALQLRAGAPERSTRTLSYADTGGGARAIKENMWLKRDDGTVLLFSAGAFPSTIVDNLKIAVGGTYRIRIDAQAWHCEKPLTVELWVGNFHGSDNHIYGYYRLPTDAPTPIELTTWLRPGDTVRPLVEGLVLPQDVKKGGPAALAAYQGRALAVRGIQVEGPLDTEPALRGQRLLFGDLPVKALPAAKGRPAAAEAISADPQRDGARLLRGFATAAFRRPVGDEQAAPYAALLRDELAKGAPFMQAMTTAAGAILCAPDFLFMIERARGPGELLDDWALATRLSYLLRRSAPDDALLRAAAAGELRTPAGLRAQAERLLAQPELQRFIADFTDGWLDLRSIEATTPDQKLYPEFDDELKFSMVQETRAFIGELIARNLPPADLVASDFAMLNGRLARHYGIPGVDGTAIRRVVLPADSHRGGLLTQASVLKVSANGTSTSPVIRGVYVMERLLGFQPPPPPPGVAGLEPDTRGAATIRQQLDKHRTLETCNGCHRLIDPPGFALERFDVIGGWRDRVRSLGEGERIKADRDGRRVGYKLGPAVDASGELIAAPGEPTSAFRDFEEFRTLLLAQRERIATTLATRLLAFGTGREMGFSDRAAIARLVKQLGPTGGVRDLLHLVIQSEAFISK